MFKQRSFVLKSEPEEQWYLVDASGHSVGRLASEIAKVLRGKNNPQYTPHLNSGAGVVVINAGKVDLTGRKWEQKKYHRYSGYVGGLKSRTAKEQLEKHPEMILYSAVKGMLPKNSLGRRQIKRLKISVGDSHSHSAQKPRELTI